MSLPIPESLLAPESERFVQGPPNIWRAHGIKTAFVPTTEKSTAATSSSTSSSTSVDSTVEAKVVPVVPLDLSQFNEDVSVVAFRIPAKKCGIFQAHFRSQPHLLLQRPRIGTIVDSDTKDTKYLLTSLTSLDQATLPSDTLTFLAKEEAKAVLYTFQLTYDYFMQDHILRKLLPSGMPIPAGFETIGHIAHLNLSDEQRPFGPLIARVILDKNPHLHTVVNKVGAIASEYRVFEMEVLAGVDSFLTEVKEHNCNFLVEFNKVYWNSRLSTEHSRLIDLFQPKELILDLMCGIGPFVVPAAKKLGYQPSFLRGAPFILGNDLNPDSYKYLVKNMERNKVNQMVQPYNQDGRAFLWDVLRKEQACKKDGPYFKQPLKHVVMNLPAIAIEFLDAFVGLYAENQGDDADSAALEYLSSQPILVHVYCFSREINNPIIDLVPRIEKALGGRRIPPAVVVKDLQSKQAKKEQASQKKRQNQRTSDKATNSASSSTSTSTTTASSSEIDDAASSSIAASLPPLTSTHIRFVRNVAPNKDMFCVQFYLPREVLLGQPSWKQLQHSTSSTLTATDPSNEMDTSNSVATSSTSTKRKLVESEESTSTTTISEAAPPTKKLKE